VTCSLCGLVNNQQINASIKEAIPNAKFAWDKYYLCCVIRFTSWNHTSSFFLWCRLEITIFLYEERIKIILKNILVFIGAFRWVRWHCMAFHRFMSNSTARYHEEQRHLHSWQSLLPHLFYRIFLIYRFCGCRALCWLGDRSWSQRRLAEHRDLFPRYLSLQAHDIHRYGNRAWFYHVPFSWVIHECSTKRSSVLSFCLQAIRLPWLYWQIQLLGWL